MKETEYDQMFLAHKQKNDLVKSRAKAIKRAICKKKLKAWLSRHLQ